MRKLIVILAMALAACSEQPQQPAAEAAVEHTAPSGAYVLDKSHASLIVRVNHMGFAHYTARFETWDASLALDTAAPENSSLTVTIDPRSINADNPPPGFVDVMRGPQFLDAAQFAEITFQSTGIERTGPNTARITGDLTLRGATNPVTLEARFNGGYEGFELDPNGRVGFSARGVFNRSAFGMDYGVPPEGTNMGVSDAVEVIVEAELTGPAWPGVSAP